MQRVVIYISTYGAKFHAPGPKRGAIGSLEQRRTPLVIAPLPHAPFPFPRLIWGKKLNMSAYPGRPAVAGRLSTLQVVNVGRDS